MSIHFKLQSPATLAPTKRISLSFKALKPGTHFSSFTVKVLDGIFFQYEATSSTSKIYSSQWSRLPWFSQLRVTCCGVYVSTCCFSRHFYAVETESFLTPREPTSTASNFLSAVSSRLSVVTELKRFRPLSGLGFGLRQCCSGFDLLFAPLTLSPYQQ